MSSYINYFEEIKHLTRQEQITLLEQARYEAFAVLKLSGKSALYLGFCVMITVAILGLPQVVFPQKYWLLWFCIPTGIAIGLATYRKLNSKLIYLGLKQVLSKQNA